MRLVTKRNRPWCHQGRLLDLRLPTDAASTPTSTEHPSRGRPSRLCKIRSGRQNSTCRRACHLAGERSQRVGTAPDAGATGLLTGRSCLRSRTGLLFPAGSTRSVCPTLEQTERTTGLGITAREQHGHRDEHSHHCERSEPHHKHLTRIADCFQAVHNALSS